MHNLLKIEFQKIVRNRQMLEWICKGGVWGGIINLEEVSIQMFYIAYLQFDINTNQLIHGNQNIVESAVEWIL